MQWNKGLSVFTKLRIKVTVVPTVLVFLVLIITFFSILWGEYNSKMLLVSEQLSEAIENNEYLLGDNKRPTTFYGSTEAPYDPYILGRGNANANDSHGSLPDPQSTDVQSGEGEEESSNPSATNIKLGVNSDFKATNYVPIILYRIDYENRVLVPFANDNATLTAESLNNANSRLIDMKYGVARDQQSMLYYLKKKTDYGDVLAFTDVSVVDSYIRSLLRAFMLVVVLVTVMIGAIVWLISGWIVRPVKETWAKQKQFIADASHELKTPISVIMANSSIILDSGSGMNENDVRKWTKATQEEAENLNLLVADMLYLATNDTEKRVITSVFNFTKVVQKTAMQFEARAFEKDNVLVYDELDANVEINGEEPGMTRVVNILLDNACKYSHPHTTITVELKDERKFAVLSVADDGDEIPDDMLESVFDRFFRVDKSRTGENGYGLGLAMARDIVERHNGTIAVESREGHTVFTVRVPKNAR